MNQAEPELKGPSVTIQATEDRIQQMHQEADQIWPPELAQLMKVTCTTWQTNHLAQLQLTNTNGDILFYTLYIYIFIYIWSFFCIPILSYIEMNIWYTLIYCM